MINYETHTALVLISLVMTVFVATAVGGIAGYLAHREGAALSKVAARAAAAFAGTIALAAASTTAIATL